MATTLRYPTVIDAPVMPTPTNLMFIVSHAGQHDFANTAIVALENMVGVTGTGAPTGTAMYGLFNTGSVSPGHKHKVTDITGDSLGPTGPTGHAGPTGPINYTGPTGPQGVTGPADGPTGPTGPSGGGGGGGASLTVNSGDKVDSGLLPLQITKQPLVQPSGIPQPLPPIFGFQFPGISVAKGTGTIATFICAGRDGSVWIATPTHHRIIRVSPTGSRLTIETSTTSRWRGICSGPDGNIWAIDNLNDRIVKVTLPTHGLTYFTIPVGPSTTTAPTHPQCVSSGVDGSLWIGCGIGSRLVRMATDGSVVSAMTLSEIKDISDVGCGPDGNMYLLTQSNYALWKVSPTSTLILTRVVTLGEGAHAGICAGPDGNLWIGWRPTGGTSQAIRVTPTGVSTIIPLGPGAATGVVAGSGGDLWYTVATYPTGPLIKVTVEGVVTHFSITGTEGFFAICVGHDGAFWCINQAYQLLAIGFLMQTFGLVLTGVPTSDPVNAGQIWNTGGTLKISAG